jgi:hypothetical protein
MFQLNHKYYLQLLLVVTSYLKLLRTDGETGSNSIKVRNRIVSILDNISKGINRIIIHCSLVENCYLNDVKSDAIH